MAEKAYIVALVQVGHIWTHHADEALSLCAGRDIYHYEGEMFLVPPTIVTGLEHHNAKFREQMEGLSQKSSTVVILGKNILHFHKEMLKEYFPNIYTYERASADQGRFDPTVCVLKNGSFVRIKKVD